MVPVCLYSKVKAVLSLPGGGGGYQHGPVDRAGGFSF